MSLIPSIVARINNFNQTTPAKLTNENKTNLCGFNHRVHVAFRFEWPRGSNNHTCRQRQLVLHRPRCAMDEWNCAGNKQRG